jgi:hypothetical protein
MANNQCPNWDVNLLVLISIITGWVFLTFGGLLASIYYQAIGAPEWQWQLARLAMFAGLAVAGWAACKCALVVRQQRKRAARKARRAAYRQMYHHIAARAGQWVWRVAR